MAWHTVLDKPERNRGQNLKSGCPFRQSNSAYRMGPHWLVVLLLTPAIRLDMLQELIKRLFNRTSRPGDMSTPRLSGELTELLSRWDVASPEDRARVAALLHPELKRIAENRMRHERRDHTLQPTALVNEFFLQLAKQRTKVWKDRGQFMATASCMMKNILLDYARAHRADKRGGGVIRVNLDDVRASSKSEAVDILALNEALEKLAAEEPRMAQVVEMRYFGGLTYTEVGEALGINERTAKRDWEVALKWLKKQLRGRQANDSDSVGKGKDDL